MTCSSGTNRSPPGSGSSRSTFGGIFTRAKRDESSCAAAHLDTDVEREVRDVGERVARIDGERGHHRQDQPVEQVVEVAPVAGLEVLPVAQLDPSAASAGESVVEQEGLLAPDHPLERGPDVGQ